MAKAFQVSTPSSLGDEIKRKMLSLGYPMKWAALGRALASETSHHYVDQSAKIKIAMSIWRKQHRKPKIEKEPPKCPHCGKEATDWCSTCSADESHQFNSEKPEICKVNVTFPGASYLQLAPMHGCRFQSPSGQRPALPMPQDFGPFTRQWNHFPARFDVLIVRAAKRWKPTQLCRTVACRHSAIHGIGTFSNSRPALMFPCWALQTYWWHLMALFVEPEPYLGSVGMIVQTGPCRSST